MKAPNKTNENLIPPGSKLIATNDKLPGARINTITLWNLKKSHLSEWEISFFPEKERIILPIQYN